MDYQLIFYHSGQTGEIERVILEGTEKISLLPNDSSSAVSPEELADKLELALSDSDLVFIVGGLDGGIQSTDSIVKDMFSSKKTEITVKEIEIEYNHAVLVLYKNQMTILLPDDIKFIKKLINGELKETIKDKFSLKEKENDNPPLEKVSHLIEQQLATRLRVKVSPSDKAIEKRSINRLSSIKFIIILLAALGLIQLVTAAYLFLTNYLI